ncbi:DUF6037 family protein [Enterococcus sp. BWT-B8]|nr:DUF6037 family protein [Enterococcus sp. BWT-B8]
MQLLEIKPLLSDMRKNGETLDKFRFVYNKVTFEVIFFIDSTPFELLFGVIDENYSFILELKPGFQLESLPDDVFYKLCDILKLRPSKEGLTSYKFLQYFAKKIPSSYSGARVQPHEVAQYKKSDVPEADKKYFCGWKIFRSSSPKNARNFEKTREHLGESIYKFCKEHSISSCWTNLPEKRKDYYSPQSYLAKKVNH